MTTGTSLSENECFSRRKWTSTTLSSRDDERDRNEPPREDEAGRGRRMRLVHEVAEEQERGEGGEDRAEHRHADCGRDRVQEPKQLVAQCGPLLFVEQRPVFELGVPRPGFANVVCLQRDGMPPQRRRASAVRNFYAPVPGGTTPRKYGGGGGGPARRAARAGDHNKAGPGHGAVPVTPERVAGCAGGKVGTPGRPRRRSVIRMVRPEPASTRPSSAVPVGLRRRPSDQLLEPAELRLELGGDGQACQRVMEQQVDPPAIGPVHAKPRCTGPSAGGWPKG